MSYETIHNMDGIFVGIRRLSDFACIPINTDNRDYAEFLIWNSEQQAPLILEDYPEGFNRNMIPNYASLKTEIETDPENLGYDGGTYAEQADLINSKDFTITSNAVPMNKIMQWAAGNGILFKLNDAWLNHTDNTIKSIAYAALKMIENPNTPTFDMSNQDNLDMIDALVIANVLTTNERDEFLALGTIDASRAEVLWGVDMVVTAIDVEIAMTQIT